MPILLKTEWILLIYNHSNITIGLADLHYREISLGDRDPIFWDNGTVRELVKRIESVVIPRHAQFEPD